jgi:hypothetical protein
LWGKKTNVKLELRLASIPFFARAIAWGDLIRVRPDHDRRELVFDRFTAESGHSTVRISVLDTAARQDIESALRSAGCRWEGAPAFENLVAVDIPPTSNYGELRGKLSSLAESHLLDFEEGAISAVHRSQLPSS